MGHLRHGKRVWAGDLWGEVIHRSIINQARRLDCVQGGIGLRHFRHGRDGQPHTDQLCSVLHRPSTNGDDRVSTCGKCFVACGKEACLHAAHDDVATQGRSEAGTQRLKQRGHGVCAGPIGDDKRTFRTKSCQLVHHREHKGHADMHRMHAWWQGATLRRIHGS